MISKWNRRARAVRRNFQDSRRTRQPNLERLEVRHAMHGEPVPWDNAAALTLSFVPDGTRVAGDLSMLDAKFSSIEETNIWQEAVASAFQTWARHANINIGVVDDSGLPLGIRGASHGDDRFGDIRVAGSPMSPETYAAAIDHTRLSAGTWTGDVLFNTEATWLSPDDIFSAALHEAGHVLGLPHSSDPTSPMFTHGISGNLAPTAEDIAALQRLYGPRIADENERNHANDTLDRAVRIRYSEAADGFDGSLPLVQFGDLHSSADADFFELPVLAGYSGDLTFEVRTIGLSLLTPRITVYNQSGSELAQASFMGHMGGVATVSVGASPSERIYVRIDRANSGLYETGGYAVVVKYDSLLATDEQEIVKAVREGFHWRGLTDDTYATFDVRPILAGVLKPHADDDGGGDDTAGGAKRLKPVIDTELLRRYQYVGTISAVGDVDHYAFRSPSFDESETRGLTVTIESLEKNGVIGDFELVDSLGEQVAVTMIANGTGLVVFHADNVDSNKDYTVRLRTLTTGTNDHTGNYTIVAEYDAEPFARSRLVSQQVDASKPIGEFTLYVARTQLFSFGLESTAVTGVPDAVAWVTLYDSGSRPVFLAASKAGSFRSAPSVLLDPGEYRVQLGSRLPDGKTPADSTLTLVGESLSDPVGPPLVDPGSTPLYSCPSGDPNPYCFPGGVTGSVPYTFVPDATVPTPDVTQVDVVDPGDSWFWLNEYLGTNPIDPFDVNADGGLAPVDALLIINFINQSGPVGLPPPPVQMPFLDVTSDRLVAPIDALMVINQLNGVDGEGEVAWAAANELPVNNAELFARALPSQLVEWMTNASPVAIDCVLAHWSHSLTRAAIVGAARASALHNARLVAPATSHRIGANRWALFAEFHMD